MPDSSRSSFCFSYCTERLSSIRTGVNVADAKIIESGVKSFKEIEGKLPRRANSFDDDNPDHHATTGWGLNYEYYRYTYPSINTKGEPVTLTALAAMPTNYKVPINNIILGCHITITDNKSTPSDLPLCLRRWKERKRKRILNLMTYIQPQTWVRRIISAYRFGWLAKFVVILRC